MTASGAALSGRRSPRLRIWPYGVVIPLLALFFTFNTLPVLRLFELSMLNWPDVVAGRGASFGLGNFRRLAEDPLFLKVLGNTLLFTLIRVPLGLAIGLLAALAIQRTRTLRALYTTAWFSPFMTSVVAMALVFTYLYNPTFGFFNYLLNAVGLPSQGFLRDPSQALASIVLVDLWKSVGFSMVIFMAGLSGIPEVYYEAASIDGATRWQALRRVTLPLLSRTTYLLLLIGVITSMRVFVPVYMMTGFSLSAGGLGGPLNSTNVLALYMYQSAFRFNDFGYAAAVAIVLFLLVLVVTLLQFRLLRTNWEY